MVVGMNRHTGRRLEGRDHIKQSLDDIITTQAYDPENNNLGERVRRREYGTRLSYFIDKPKNPQTLALMRPRILESIMNWEQRVSLRRILLIETSQSGLSVSLQTRILINNQEITFDGLVL